MSLVLYRLLFRHHSLQDDRLYSHHVNQASSLQERQHGNLRLNQAASLLGSPQENHPDSRQVDLVVNRADVHLVNLLDNRYDDLADNRVDSRQVSHLDNLFEALADNRVDSHPCNRRCDHRYIPPSNLRYRAISLSICPILYIFFSNLIFALISMNNKTAVSAKRTTDTRA